MKKQLFTAWMVMVLGTMSISVQAEVAPPPPKPECKDIIYRKWNDLLFVDNSNEEYVAYQWYKNQVAIDGATRQYLYTEGVTLQGDGNIYHVVVTLSNGSQIISCEGRFEDFSASAPLNPGKNAIRRATLYTYSGHKVGEWESKPEHLSVPAGCYIWHFVDEEGMITTERVLY